MRIRILCCSSLTMAIAFAGTTPAADWPFWRGPNHDNVSTETGWRTDWKANPPSLLWKAATGFGQACPVIANGRVFVHGDDNAQAAHKAEYHQTLFALDAATGKELWKDDTVVTSNNNQPITYSPAVDGDRVYFYSSSATLKCLEAATGKPVWVKDLPQTLGTPRFVNYGYRCSPVVWQDRVIVTVRTPAPKGDPAPRTSNLTAFNKLTGEVLWTNSQPSVGLPYVKGSYGPWGANWHTPTPATIQGRAMVLFNTGASIVGVDMQDGKTLWEWKVPEDELLKESGVSAVSPVVTGDIVIFHYWSGHASGHTYALRVKPDFSVERLWKSDDLTGWKFVCTTAYKDAVFGFHQPGVHAFGPLTCIDLATGKKKWSQDKVGSALTIVDGYLLLWDGVRVRLAEAAGQGYRELGVTGDLPTTAAVLTPRENSVTRSSMIIPPILSNGRLYCRNISGDLFCLDVRREGSP